MANVTTSIFGGSDGPVRAWSSNGTLGINGQSHDGALRVVLFPDDAQARQILETIGKYLAAKEPRDASSS